MARIRSIKPDFFTSEVIASLPLSARLTFIGLWTYVDDNGVGLDNDRLIVAAIWPLEEDFLGTIQMVQDDLRRLSGVTPENLASHSPPPLIERYADGRSRYLHIRSWDEHQKVSHPRKSRYPLPSEIPLTCTNTHPPEPLRRHSGNPPEPLRPEQGAGSREQGAGKRVAAANGTGHPPPRPPRPPSPPATPAALTLNQRSKAITDQYAAAEPMCKWPAINGIVAKAIQARKWSDHEIRDALLRLAKEGRGVTVETLRIELCGLPPINNHKQSTADERSQQAIAIGAEIQQLMEGTAR